MKSGMHFKLLCLGTVAFALWLAFGLDHGDWVERWASNQIDVSSPGGQWAKSANLQHGTAYGIDQIQNALVGLSAYLAFAILVVGHAVLGRNLRNNGKAEPEN
jgi:hypothetical protein